MACSYLGRLTGRGRLISLDMGGTTAKAAIVEDGRPVRTSEYEVGAGINLSSKLVKGGGHPIKLPFIDVSEIGAGGGSIVSVDPLGSVAVGPRQRGRRTRARRATAPEEPSRRSPTRCSCSATSTPRALGGGAITLAPRAGARGARAGRGEPLGRSVEEAAHGILAARGRDDDARGQGRDDLPRPRPARFRALRVRRQRAADRRRDGARARDPAGARPSGARRLQRPGPAVLGHRARGRADADAARSGRSPATGCRRPSQRSRPRRRVHLDDTGGDAVFNDAVRGRPLCRPGIRAARARACRRASTSHGSWPTSSPSTFARTAIGSVDDPVDIVSIRALAPRRADGVAALRPARGHPRSPARRGNAARPTSAGRQAPSRPRSATGPACSRATAPGPLLVDEPDSTCVVPPGCVARLDDHGNIEIDDRHA